MQNDRHRALSAALRPPKAHQGPILTHGPGRTDNVDMGVTADSFVIPADVVSSLGQGNTLAGMKVLDQLFGAHGTVSAKGGAAKTVPIVAAGGEYVMSPAQVARVGDGDVKRGHSILDAFVKHSRAKAIKTLKKLPGPAKD